ncbi:MAG: hypothetical protein COU29_00740 [Candidatus Magasanikbacteria bacterium CG10_big_fil_rev_8_21_14_0_10_36_32]|uniref:Cell shape determination protein CcmA n=1 Tax=Candidatus Magasanikbacteria bacterium CG10_big_fil_rev_8_21_14_0_10_36_32 TaxID=1974646 RepID=A0A2M6W6A1_9BACT|nr:MAG: hypothetical protein COU29_00740 [Candidatus Magasanikbacteria bacterium CG10_big_fil_rev_8_21_14_0_10_36_32]
MIFQRSASKNIVEETVVDTTDEKKPVSEVNDNVDTVVGPSVNVEGDFSSEGNIIVKGTVTGSLHTSKSVTVETGAKIFANVRAGSAHISGEVRGNMKIKDFLELSPSARIVGDIEAKTVTMEAGALLLGKVSMPGLETNDGRTAGRVGGRVKKSDEAATVTL